MQKTPTRNNQSEVAQTHSDEGPKVDHSVGHLKRWLRIAVAIAILSVILRSVPLSQIIASLRHASPWLVIAGILAASLSVIASAARLFLLVRVQRLQVTVGQLVELNFVTTFYGLLLPGTLVTGAYRWHRLTQLGGRGAQTLMAILFSRLNCVTVLVLLALIFRLWEPAGESSKAWVGILLVLTLFLGVIAGGAAGRIPVPAWLLKCRLPARLRGGLVMLSRCASYHRAQTPETALAVWCLSLVDNLLVIVSAFLLSQALGIEIGFVTLAWVTCAAEVATMIPVSVGGIGVRDAGLLLLLHPYGIPAPQVVALSFLIFGTHIALGVVGVILELRRVLSARYNEPQGS